MWCGEVGGSCVTSSCVLVGVFGCGPNDLLCDLFLMCWELGLIR